MKKGIYFLMRRGYIGVNPIYAHLDNDMLFKIENILMKGGI